MPNVICLIISEYEKMLRILEQKIISEFKKNLKTRHDYWNANDRKEFKSTFIFFNYFNILAIASLLTQTFYPASMQWKILVRS